MQDLADGMEPLSPIRRGTVAEKQVILFHHWTMEKLAQKVVADPAYMGRVRLGRCSWELFPDQTPSIQIAPEDCLSMDASDHGAYAMRIHANAAHTLRNAAHIPCRRSV